MSQNISHTFHVKHAFDVVLIRPQVPDLDIVDRIIFWELVHFTLSVNYCPEFPILSSTWRCQLHDWRCHIGHNTCILDDSHHTGTSEIIQQLKVFPHNSEAYVLTMFFTNTLFGPISSFLCPLEWSLQHF